MVEADMMSFKYIGETSRTALTRQLQHHNKYKTGQKKQTGEKEEEERGGKRR